MLSFSRPSALPAKRGLARIAAAVVLAGVLLPTVATGTVQAASFQAGVTPPCQTTGVHAPAITWFSGLTAQYAYLGECSSGGYYYVQPVCGVLTGDRNAYDPFKIDECNVFVWSGGTYVGRYGFSNVSGWGPKIKLQWYTTSSTAQLSGYTVSSEMCSESGYFGSMWVWENWGCVQSPPTALGA
jgi:hypothetical protein